QLERSLADEREQNHLIGLDVADLGRFDVWLSTTLNGPEGIPVRGQSPVEPVQYRLDVSIDRFVESITGHAHIDLDVKSEGLRAVPLELGPDMRIDGIKDRSGRDLFFVRTGRQATAFLAEPVKPHEAFSLDVDFSGNPFEEKRLNTIGLQSTLG